MASYRPDLTTRANRARKAYVFASWSGPCILCNRPIDMTLSGLDPNGPTLEHIIPVSRGGDPLAFENQAVSHRTCNLSRGNKLLTELPKKLRTSRDW